ncbi:hypothetical protein ACIA6C_27810 [Streptomyces sp. NPDC051578]|uniref:hypothetical protein n=1 Tax=Streptomyces sp. NPDC051578 TaxID=3365662 RepID=UPI00379CDDA6
MSVDEGTWIRRMKPEAEAELIRQLAQRRTDNAIGHRPSWCSCDVCRIEWAAVRRQVRAYKQAARAA